MRFRALLFVALIAFVTFVVVNVTRDVQTASVVIQEEIKEITDPRALIGSQAPEVVHVVVEIEEGTQSRYKYKEGIMQLVDAPYHPLNMPGDYGVLPQTLSKGGDPLGVIILTTDPTPPGTLIVAKPIALLIVDEGKVTRNVILAVPTADIRYKDVEEIADLQQKDKNAVIAFIQNYRTVQGRPAVSVEAKGSTVAKTIIEIGMQAYTRMNQ